MRILIVTEFFDPEPTIKGLSFAQALADRGHDVQVLTGFPSYPLGRLYDGYTQRLVARERHGSVEVVRVPLFASHDRSAIRRIATYCSFALSAATIGLFETKRPDVIYAYHPPITVGLAAMVHSVLRAVPLVYDVQDLWPDTLRATGMVGSGTVLGIVGAVCNMVYAAATRIAVLSPGFRTQLVERGVAPEKIDVIYNWATEDDAAAGAGLPPSDAFTVLFAGTMGLAQGLDVVLAAAQKLTKNDPRIRFVFMGGGADKGRLAQRANDLGLRNVEFLPPRPISEMTPVLRSADALLIHLRDDPLFRITIPSKTQAYLAAGRPILIGALGDARDLVEQAQAGIAFAPDDGDALADAVRTLAGAAPTQRAAMGERGRAFYERHLSRARGILALEHSMAAACGREGAEATARLSS
jgi:colanic acid biosynthesis glycosyl transferase WcaI